MNETPLGKELPERRRADVAEDGIRAAGEHGCHPSPLLAEAEVPDGVDPAMNAVKSLRGDTASPTLLVNPRLLELRERDDAVLIRRKPGNEGVASGIGEFPFHGER